MALRKHLLRVFMKQDNLSFEEAFQKVEKLLAEMKTSQLSLDQSLSHYQNADKLIRHCQKLLEEAEEKVESLVKSRGETLALNDEGVPEMETFNLSSGEAAKP